jgi:hypothetical protein
VGARLLGVVRVLKHRFRLAALPCFNFNER